MKKTILHFIYDLGRGGAETMLVRTLKELPEYNNIVVTLYPHNEFKKELEGFTCICLNQGMLLSFPFTALRLKRIIEDHKVDLVHTHLFWPTLIARMGTPKHIPLVSTIHAFIATSVEYRKWYIRLLDKLSYKLRNTTIIGVAKGATAEYFSFLGLKPYRSYSLYTFVDVDRFRVNGNTPVIPGRPFRVISTGALRLQKNQQYLVNAFSSLKEDDIELHIYGDGPLREQLQSAITDSGSRVVLKGVVNNMEEVLPQYNLFVMSSTFEGFSLAVLETMAMKVPMLLSDIVSFREQCGDTAVYFNINDPVDFANKLKQLAGDSALRSALAEKAYQRVTENFTLQHHMKQLKEIYNENIR